ncbi:MAG: DinB family protein [Anaerolineae bacterium]|nr:DinB family protein [Anaerolineae bacterium]
MSERKERLLERLQKGMARTEELFASLSPEQWEQIVYINPPWTTRDLLAHFFSAEEALRYLLVDIARGGGGAPEEFELDAMNAAEQARLADVPREKLLADLIASRQQTIEFVAQLDPDLLDRVGRHPGLGEITVETFVDAIYGHQLFHVRDLKKRLGL